MIDEITAETDDTLTINTVGCARCHGDGHKGMVFQRLTHPTKLLLGIEFTHWAMCPVTQEPVMFGSAKKP